jgi:DNA-binding NarL/FixJ family response regulator
MALGSHKATDEPRHGDGNTSLVIIDRRALTRECLVRALQSDVTGSVLGFPSVGEWQATAPEDSPEPLLVLCFGNGKLEHESAERELALVLKTGKDVPVVLLSDAEDITDVFDAFDNGVQGYIPTSVPLNVAVQALNLVRAGGIYVPADSLLLWKRSGGTPAGPANNPFSEVFTTRQAAVLSALREGKSNKIIAYDLSMRESTVKVHVRNIMRKTRAIAPR